MYNYKSKKTVVILIDIVSIALSFIFSMMLRYKIMLKNQGNGLSMKYYSLFFALAIVLYVLFSVSRRYVRLEKSSYYEIGFSILVEQIEFVAMYIMCFFIAHMMYYVSRIFIVVFLMGNIMLCMMGRIIYREICLRRIDSTDTRHNENDMVTADKLDKGDIQHVYIIGSKSIGMYGGYESFVMNLLQQHEHNPHIKYHIACKANGSGCMEVENLPGATLVNDVEFNYYNAHCFLLKVPEKIGAAQAIYYDLKALEYVCDHIERNHIPHPIVYILASRVGPFEKKYVRRIHAMNGKVYHNPDGHEDRRGKWNVLIRKYWKLSERYAVKNADLVVCDSKHIESYIQDEYSEYKPQTTFIAYGSHINHAPLADDNPKFVNWLRDHNLRQGSFYCMVGRCVPENNYETIIREYMLSHTTKDLAIITTDNPKMLKEMEQKLHYRKDKRIKFVGTVYDQELLAKIRENACGYFHGHSVGGTNPSLLEALGATKLNLLYDVGFNREVAEDAALYWSLEEGNLAKLIDMADQMDTSKIEEFGKKAKQRIQEEYSWEYICDKYANIFI